MLDKLIDLIIYCFDRINPFVMVESYEGVILMRMGQKKKILGMGLHLFPLKLICIDNILSVNVKKDTLNVEGIVITTVDDKTVTVDVVIEFEIDDIVLNLLETNDAPSNFNHVTRGITADYLVDLTWDELKKRTTLTEVKNKIKTAVKDMGYNVKRVYLSKISLSRTFNLLKS